MIELNPRLLLAAVLVTGAAVSASAPMNVALDGFHAQCDKAMDAMMKGMSVSTKGNVDTDFSQMMIPHHQGAIDMAVAELRYGRNEQLRRIAQEIIVDQRQEIDAMRIAVGQPPLRPSAAPTVPPTSRPSKEQ